MPGSQPGAGSGGGQPGKPAVRSESDFFGHEPSGADFDSPSQTDDAAGREPDGADPARQAKANALEALLDRAQTQEEHDAAKAMLDELRGQSGRTKAEAQRANEAAQASQANFNAAQGWKKLATLAMEAARDAGIDTQQLERLAGEEPSGEAPDAGGYEDGPVSQQEFVEASEQLFEHHLGQDWEKAYLASLSNVEAMMRTARKAAEDGDTETSKLWSDKARQASLQIQREQARAITRPLQSLIYALGSELAQLKGQYLGEKQQGSESKQYLQTLSSAIYRHGVARDDGSGEARYPGLFEPGSMKPAANGKELGGRIGQWCRERGLDPSDPEAFDDAYHSVVRRHPHLVSAAPKTAGPRTPGGDASLGGGTAPADGSGGNGSYLGASRDEDMARRRNNNTFGSR